MTFNGLWNTMAIMGVEEEDLLSLIGRKTVRPSLNVKDICVVCASWGLNPSDVMEYSHPVLTCYTAPERPEPGIFAGIDYSPLLSLLGDRAVTRLEDGIGVTHKVYKSLTEGKIVRMSVLKRIAGALGCTPDWMFRPHVTSYDSLPKNRWADGLEKSEDIRSSLSLSAIPILNESR